MKTISLIPFLLMLFNTVWATAVQDVNIIDPYARAVPPGQPNSAVFMQLNNRAKQMHKIVSAKSNVSAIVELHTHIHEDGMMKMRRIESIDIPPEGATALKPGGLHIMLINLYEGLNPGDNVELEITFADGSKTSLIAPVRKIMGMKGMMHQGKNAGHHGNKMAAKGELKQTNPMPNLMQIVKQQAENLALSAAQKQKLAEWRENNHAKVHAMMQQAADLEAQLHQAGLAGQSKADILQLAAQLMQLRTDIIATKTDCRDNLKQVLGPEQYARVIQAYQAKQEASKN